MGHWFSKFIRGKLFSVLFCALVLGLILYLSSRLGALIEAFTALDLRAVVFVAMVVFFTYMLVYDNSGKVEKRTRNCLIYAASSSASSPPWSSALSCLTRPPCPLVWRTAGSISSPCFCRLP